MLGLSLPQYSSKYLAMTALFFSCAEDILLVVCGAGRNVGLFCFAFKGRCQEFAHVGEKKFIVVRGAVHLV